MSLTGVHSVIQAAMGWLDCHLWTFEANGRKYGTHLPDDPDWNGRLENAGKITLGALLHGGERQMQYVYDMGDFWEHSIIFERVMAPVLEVSYPQFFGGERRCQRWSRFREQNGGLAKVDSGFDYAANFSSFACIA
jgi:hypothetical protein